MADTRGGIETAATARRIMTVLTTASTNYPELHKETCCTTQQQCPKKCWVLKPS